MPNYRKKNQNYRNKNKNKNKNQNTSSSSVKQEHRIVETTTTAITSPGNEPNLPADVVRNSYTASANKSVFEEKHVVVVVNVDESSSISPLSNEEIDGNSCNVDIDTLSVSEDKNTAPNQSNYSSAFNCASSSKKSTEIEHRQSSRTIFDSRDSTLGNSVIRDTLVEEASSGKNSFKTGSVNTKDGAVPAAETSSPSASATQSIESTRISASVSEKVRDTPEKRSGRTDSATEVNETHNRSSHISSSKDHSSKVIVHKVVVKNGSETSQSTSIHQIPSEESSKVIVHQISKEDPPIHQPKSHVIVQREEQSSSTSHRASKNNQVDLSKKVISKQVSKKKAIRTNTSSLQTSTQAAESSTTQTLSFSNVRGQPSREAVYEVLSPKSPRKVIIDPFLSGHGPSRAIIHQISKEEGLHSTAEDISKVIVHQVSREEKQRTASSSETVLTQHMLPQTTEHKVILHQISPSKVRENSSNVSKPSSPNPVGIFDQSIRLFDHSTFQHGFDKKTNIDQKDGFETSSERAGSFPETHPTEQHKKVIIIPILQENATQTSPLPSFSENPLHSSLLEIIKDESSQPKSSSDQEKYRQTSSSPLSRSPVICFENLSESFELPKDIIEESSKSAEGPSPISSPETLQEKITNEIERPIVQKGEQSKPRRKSPQRAENLEPLKIPSFPVTRPEKMIIHPIRHEPPMKQSFPFCEKSIKSLDSTSKKMASKILKEVSSELKSSLLTKRDTKEIEEVSIEKVRTSFPISLKTQGSLRPGFFETKTFETEVNPMDSESKVIVHQILKENQQTEDLHQLGSKPNANEKVIVHQISREETKSSTESKEHLNTIPNVKVITHQISQESSTSSKHVSSKPTTSTTTVIKNQERTPTNPEDSKVFVHQIQVQESQNSTQSESKSTESTSESASKPAMAEEKVILHQISREEILLDRSPSFPLDNNIKQKTIQSNLPSSKKSPHMNSFPVSSLKINHPEQYNSRSTVLEQKTINCQALRDKSKFRQSCSTLTSPFTLPKMAEDKRQGPPNVITHPILQYDSKQSDISPSGSSQSAFPISAEKQKQSKFTTHPIFSDTSKPIQTNFPVSSGPSFPFSKEKEIHATQYFRPQDRLQQTIDLQSLRNSSEFRQSSSTMTSTYGTTEMGNAKDQPQEIIHRVTKEESSSLQQCPPNENITVSKESMLSSFSTSSESAFPTSNVKEIHNVQYSRPHDRLQETIDLQSLRDSSEFRQSSSTMTSTYGLTEMGGTKDQPQSKEVIHKVIKEESSNRTQAQSTDSETSIPEKPVNPNIFTPSDTSFPFTDDKEIHATQYLRPQERQQKSINLQSLRESSEFRQSSSTLTSTFGLTEMVNKEDKPESNVIIHKVVKEESSKDHQPQTLDHQTSQDGSVSSSEGSAITAIKNDSPRSLSPPEAEAQKPKETAKEKAPKSSFFLAPLELPMKNQPESSEVTPSPVKVINHAIVRQLDKPLGYRVESPQPDKILTITKKSKSFDDDDVVIQEMSDTSSAGDTDNPPVVSEADSETDTLEAVDEFPDISTSSSLLSVQTLPFDHEEESLSPKSSQDYKIRRQQNRAALESHFLPQFLAPNFLDSIKEENSDLSDSERRSSCSDRIDPPVQHTDLDDDVFLDPPKKANAVYPKSNLDFSKKHKHVLNVRPPKTSVIREEASPPSVVEAKIIDQGSIEESCSSWSTEVTAESEAAEIVYIDSASSSVSDLLELDYSQGQSDESMDVRIQTPTIDLDSVNEMFATCQPVETNDQRTYTPPSENPPPPPPVKEDEDMNEQNLSPSHNKNDVREISKQKQTTEEEQRKNFKFDEIISEKIESMSEAAIDTHRNADDFSIPSAAAPASSDSDRAENSIANNLNSCDSAIDQIVRSNTTSPPTVSAVGSIKNMENIREIVNASTASASSSNEKSELGTIPIADSTDHGISKPNFMIGKPCSDHTLKCDKTSSTSSSSSSSCTTTTTTTTTTNRNTTEQNILTLHDLCETLDDTKRLNNPPVSPSSSTLGRQESLDSHGSDQSHSTNQSQCTAINQGSLPHCDWNEFDTTTDTTYVSESDTAAGLASSEASSPLTTKGGQTSGDETDSPPIRKLRSLCTEALASMPYGEEVLEELATVAQNIRDMPYPLPELPQIQDIQLSLGSQPEKSSVITLSQVPPRPAKSGQKFKSPPPPPVPEPPSKYDSWLGVPTESDPNVLVCLSPSQRNAVKSDSTADSLLDMHKKFVERRGYHEYTTKEVSAMNQASTSEVQKLNKIDSPPPPPLPPRPPVQSSNPNGNTDINDDEEDQNNHRLLAIIRDTHETQQQQQHSSMTSTSENISRRSEGGTQTHHNVNTNNKDGGGSCLKEEFANSPGSVSKQSQERKFDSESNKSHSEMQQSQSEHSTKFGSEPVLGMKFPTSDYFDSIFAGTNKRFSNIETGSSPGFCSQILATQPKRYSNIETSSFESKKYVENGKVLYDVSDSKREKISEGDEPDSSAGFTKSFPELSKKETNGASGSFPFVATPNQSTTSDSRPHSSGDSENIMSAFNLNTAKPQASAPPAVESWVESSPPAPPVPPLPPTFAADTTATSSSTTTTKSTSKSESLINRSFNGKQQTAEKNLDDFRQHAKEAAAGNSNESTTEKSSAAFQHEKLFKDFDDLSNLLKDELESGKRRPPATLNGSDIPSSVSDYNRVARESRIQSSHVSSTTNTETNRREQMKKLADEIDQTAKQRQQHRREMRIPIKIERSVGNGPRSAPELPQQPKTYDIPVQIENGNGTRPSLQHQRSYEIPIRVEHSNTQSRQRTKSEHQSQHTVHDIPVQVEKSEPERFRRAESMFNISDSTSSRHHLHHDDWMKYVGDLGSSENICKPFQREVEICYLGRRPNIRAPRMSASTSDLSSIHSYDTHGAYDVRRTTQTQTPRPQQPPRPSYLSTQSLIDTTPITPCVSSSRRSPAPERRSSLPREIHDKQLKYITSKEQQLKYEFERLENERRQLIDEMNRVQINQRINREAYRQRQLPPLTEDESFRQQMASEWLDKVAEREERRLQKIIKISKINQEAGIPVAPPRRHSTADDIGDEFLRRVKERRSKLCMPSDSDWESGAESQPLPRTDGSRSENEEPPVTVFEGQSTANIKQLPKHLREFAKLTSQSNQEHREEVTENSSSSATKRTSLMTTVKTTSNNNNSSTHESKSMQQDAAHVRDLEQSTHSQQHQQGKRPKLVTILRHKKPADSCGSGGGANSSCQHQTAAGAPATSGGGNGNNANSAIKRRKQTRFLLTPNRRSWSESDLLREIDKELVLAKGFLYANGVWTPKNQTPTSSRNNLNDFHPHNNNNNNNGSSRSTTNSSPSKNKSSENRSSSASGRNQKGIPTPPPPPLWTPQPERKQFRPVHFESPTLQRRYVRQQSSPSEVPSPPWSYTNSQPFPGYQSQSCTNLSQKDTAISWPPPSSSSLSSSKEPPASVPTAIVNDPVVVEVEDDIDVDEGFAPTTSIAEKIRSFERSNSNYELHRPLVRHNPHEKPAIIKPNDVIFSVKNEYMSEPETEYDKPKKMAQLSRRQYDGIGPTTKHGMPVILRSEVKEPNQHEWYKRIFQTIHKQKNPDDYVTISYKCPRGRYPYKSNGYMSEPEPNYDSDYSTVKYRTLERRRLQSTGTGTESRTSARTGNESQDETFYGTMPNPVKSGQGSYKVQPGRIENYITGHSSVSEKEKKEWWDEVMDIFNGQLDQQKLSPHYTEGNLSRALLKEQGYTSDSNIVFRKKDVPILQSPLSPVEQKQVYKSVQAGGQPPLLGFRKPAPEKPKETEFEYLPITPTLTKIRVHSKELVMSKNHRAAERGELICYPISNISRPIDVFAPFPKHVPSFIPLHQAPMPPNRKSSRTRTNSMGLRISSPQVRRPTSSNSSRHEACFQTKDAISPPPPKPTKYGTITLRKTVKTEPLMRSKSAGAVVSILTTAKEEKTRDERVSRKQQSVRLSSCSPVRNASRLSTFRATSRSPVAFGRSVSKERSFAEEKKRIEETLPSVRTDFTASTNILRDPRLKSPDQVKRAVRSYAIPIERSKSAPKVLPMIKPAMSSYVSTYVIRRVPSPLRKDSPKRNQTSTPTRSLIKDPPVVRSKSQSSKLPEKISSKPLAKTCSTVSLARTSSTFSVDSIGSKAKPLLQKKTLTISRPSSKAESEKPKRKPITISSSKSDSNVLKKIRESPEMKKKIIKAIPNQQKIVRTNHFFQNLFMRDTSPKRIEPTRQTAVQEKTRYWNTMTLPTKKSICDSRSITYRSLSPPTKPHFIQEYESVEHFHSEDECSEFGDRSGRTEDLVWQYEQRSLSEPRPMKSLKPVSDIARPESPGRICTREFSPTREIRVPQTREMRSPSRRRIENFRDSHRGETGKVIRASSLSSADDRSKRSLYNCDDFSHSANSLDYIERHSPSCRFSNSDRFIDLNRFYNTLERVGQLERATSATSLKPIRKEGEPLDFEEWRKIRFHERAEKELSYLVSKLKEDQKEKDFLFRPKDVEDVKWVGNRDLSLKSKEKSVEDLRENFEKKIQQEWLDENKRLELESKKDTYKPYWRGNSVADLASHMEIKFNPESGSYGVKKTKSEVVPDKPLCLSNRLISTLSKDQVTKITQQLNEIYNPSEPRSKPDISEKYVITVDKHTPANALKVRCNSSISKDELIGPVLRKKEASEKHVLSKKVDDRQEILTELTESEKKRLSQNFCREIQGKARSHSPNIVGRETRGAIAAENAKIIPHEIPPPPPLPKDLLEVKKPAPQKPKRKSTEDQKNKTEKPSEEQTPETEHSSCIETTIEAPEETVSKKIQYFEERKFKEPPKTIYHAREDSSPDEDEIMRVIEANIKTRAQSGKYHHQEMSSSVTDLKDLFGEKESSRINFPMPRPPPPPDETMYHETKQNQNQSTSLTLCASRVGSFEDLETLFRSRSISPQSKETSYLHRVNTGEVQKIKDKFESLGRPKKKKHFFALSPLRKVRSDPELSNDGSKDTFKTIVGEHELGDVSCIAQKFEVRQSSGRGRSRVRKPGSPIQRMPIRKEDRLMPHIDIISKTASLKQEMIKSRSPSPARQQATLHAGEVERIRCIFETSPDRTSPVGQPRLGTSSPDLRDISPHLTASWIAHKFPRPLDNDLRSPPPPLPTSPPPPLQPKKLVKSDSMPIKEAKHHHEHCYRSRSISPPKSKKKRQVISILKPRFDFFANQKFDPLIHRPKATYVPDSGDDGLKKSSQCGVKKTSAVKFKDDDDDVPTPPVPPTKGVHLPLDLNNGSYNLESPNRYFESDVNIHYKTPIRYEYKDPIPEEELAIRQAETMQKLYQEERRRKYLQELQDMTSRRHTDNFTPSQKSPIPLNRYDDFKSDLAPKSPNTSNYPRTVARALYNFQGQTARELTFKKGDVIYIRRQIDKNWYEGEHNAMIGLLPSNYVELLSKDGIRQPPKKPSEGQARAKYNFQAQSGIELSLNKGEHVTLTRRVDENWYEGKIANRKGIFPVSYVEVLVDIGAEDRAAGRLPVTQSIITQSSSSMRPSLDTLRTNINNEFNSLTSNGQPPNGILRETRTLHKTEVLHVDTNTEPVAYRALYKYRPQNTDELELQEGDIVFVLEKCDDGWFVGTSQRSGCFGTFPGNYVERV